MADLADALNLIQQQRKSTLSKSSIGQQLLTQNKPTIDTQLLNTASQRRSNPLLDKINTLSDKISGGSKHSTTQSVKSVQQPSYQTDKQSNQKSNLSQEIQLLLQQKEYIDQELYNTFALSAKTERQHQQPQQQQPQLFQNKPQQATAPQFTEQIIRQQNNSIEYPQQQPNGVQPNRQSYQEQNYQNIINQLKNQITDLENENKSLKEQLHKQQEENKAIKEDFNKQLTELEYQIMNMNETDKQQQQETMGRKIIQAYAQQNTQLQQPIQQNQEPIINNAVQQPYQPPTTQVVSQPQQQQQQQESKLTTQPVENNFLTQSAGSMALELASQQAQNDINQNGISEFDKKWKELEEIEVQQEQLRQQRSRIIDEQLKDQSQQYAVQQRSSIFAHNIIQRERQQEKQTDLLNKIQSNNSQIVYKHQCMKILLPESTGLKEQAAKRVVILEKTNEGPILAWYRQNGAELQISGIMQLAQIVNVAAAEQAQLFRSKVLAARKAGYVNDIFDLIGQGIIDQLEPANMIKATCSVIFFTDSAVLCFDFGSDKEEFEIFCKALLDLGV